MFEGRNFNNELLLEMYNMPTSELSTEQIAEIISEKTGLTVDTKMVSTIYKALGESLEQDLDLRKRLRIPKVEVVKEKRVTKADVLNNLFSQLGIVAEENVADLVNEELIEYEENVLSEHDAKSQETVENFRFN